MTAEPEPVESAASATGHGEDTHRGARCSYCGQAQPASLSQTPFALLLAVARLVIAAGAAIALTAIVIFLFRTGWRRLATGELWALFATFVLSIGVLLLYEIRDALLGRIVPPQAAPQRHFARPVAVPLTELTSESWRTVGALAYRVWRPFQAERDRLLLDHLTSHERRELLERLATITLCFVTTTLAPVVISFIFLSPTAVCIGATAIAANLFVLDWFKKRHKRWLYATGYAREHGIQPVGEQQSAFDDA
jgi:hypothetical protein